MIIKIVGFVLLYLLIGFLSCIIHYNLRYKFDWIQEMIITDMGKPLETEKDQFKRLWIIFGIEWILVIIYEFFKILKYGFIKLIMSPVDTLEKILNYFESKTKENKIKCDLHDIATIYNNLKLEFPNLKLDQVEKAYNKAKKCK